jgi:hypothetical protein
MTILRTLGLIIFVTLCSIAALAESPLPGLSYDMAIPTPRTVFGFEVGDRHFSHDELLRYFEILDRSSDRLRLVDIGRTHEMRRQVLAFISTPENLARLDTLQAAHTAYADGASDVPGPLVVWLGYSVHGNEASGAHASTYVAYHLAAAPYASLEVDLSNTVVILEPSINPDGMQRFSSWVNMHRGETAVSDGHNREHNEVWPGGRTNHYWFDLNRDWLLQQQPESQARVAMYQRWLPHVVGDYHEMGTNNTYFFQPGIPTRNNPRTPRRVIELTHAMAAYHAEALDALNQPYYTEESFDDFYYGKGSSYPDLQGSVGILFEQASARGLVQDSPNGEVTFQDAIRNQFATSRSLLRGSQALRGELAEHQRTTRINALAAGRAAGGGWVFENPANPARVQALALLLARHDIRVHRAADARDHRFVVPADQVRYPLIQTLFEPVTEFADATFYDVSAWDADLAYDVDVRRVLELPATGERVTRGTVFGTGAIVGRPERVAAYVLDWAHDTSARAAVSWLNDDLRLRVMTKPFSMVVAGRQRSFGPGAMILPVGNQDQDAAKLREIVTRTVAETGATVFAAGTSLTGEGPDLGGSSTRPIRKPKVLLVAGRPGSAYEIGEIWHLSDHRLGLATTLVEPERLRSTPLRDYTHVVMVDGDYRKLDARAANKLRQYACNGGTIIAQRRAVQWWVEQGVSRVKLASAQVPTDDEPYADRSTVLQQEKIAGAILATRFDVTHPLGYGLADAELPMFRRGELVFESVPDRFANVARYAPEPRLSGFVSDPNRGRLAGTPAVISRR